MGDKSAKAKGKGVAVTPRSSVVPDFDHELERFFGRRWPRLFDWPDLGGRLESAAPKVDVIDRDSEVCVRAELPGFRKEDIEVSLSDSAVTIKATSTEETGKEEGDFHRKEIRRDFVSRTVALPSEVDGTRAVAKLNDGVLEITAPKVERARRQTVEIR